MSVDVKKSPENGSPVSAKESTNCSPLIVGRAEDMNNAFKGELNKAISERDDMWRRHEKEQIAYLQNQNNQMLSRLHTEIERLQHLNRDLERRLYVNTEPETFDELRSELNHSQLANDRLKKELTSAENRSRLLAKTLEESAKLYKDQVTEHEARIRQLSNELDHKTLTITQLSTQLRNFKLREAMAQAQQRRRASCAESSRQVSPNNPFKPSLGFRLFAGTTSPSSASSLSPVSPTQRIHVDVPGNGSVVKPNASVSVSYPTQAMPYANRRLPFINSMQRTSENSIEKPAITRSMSAAIPPTKTQLLQALRSAPTEDSV